MLETFRRINYVYLVVLSGNVLALTGDSTHAWTSPVLSKLSRNGTDNPLGAPLSKDELSWLASISGIGSVIGVLPFIFLPNLIGRKPSLLLISITHMLSFGLAAVAKTVYLLYIARFLSGLSTVACYTVLPMYVAEISENHNRGLMLVSFAVFSHFGCLVSYFAGPFLSMFWFNILLLLFPAVFFVSFSVIAPESPYFYVMRKDYKKAIESIEKLRCNNSCKNPELELDSIISERNTLERGNVLNTLTKRHAIKGSLIVLVLKTFEKLSGKAVFTAYTEQIFMEAGSSVSDSATSSMIVGSVAFAASFFCPFIIDKKGRRYVLTISICGIILSELIFGMFYYMKEQEYDVSAVKWIPLMCLMGYMVFVAFGLDPLPLTIASEILPGNIKFFVSMVGSMLGSGCSGLLLKNYYFLNDNLNYSGTVWMFAGFCILLLIFVLLVLPETKGKSFSAILEELER